MTKQYNLKVSVQTAKPRSKRLRLSGGTARSEVSSAGIYESGLDLSRYLEKELFDDLFEKVQVNGQWVIRAKYGFYSNQFISALGLVQGDLGGGTGTGGGSLFGLMRSWPSVDPGPSTQEALGANLGWELRGRIAALETAGFATQNWVLNKNYLTAHQDISHLLSKTEAASLYQPKGNYLTSHQSLTHLLRIDGSNGTAAGVSTLIGKLSNATADVLDSTKFVTSDNVGDATSKLYYRRPATALWNYIKGKADAVYQPKGNYALASALGNYYTKTEINTKLTDGSVTKVGTATVGSSNWPIYLNNGVPYACAWKFGNYNGAAAVNNGTLNENLNADLLDGLHVGEATGRVARFYGFPGYTSFGYEGTADETYFSYLLKKLATDNSGEIMAVGRAHPNSQGVFIMHGYPGRKNGYPQYGSGLYVSISGRVAPIRVYDGIYTYGDGIFEGNAASASRLQTTATYTAWGQTYFANGVPQSVSGNMTGVGSIRFSGTGELIVSNNRLCFGEYNQSAAAGVNVGSLLVSNVWADYTKVPVNGIYIKGALRIGDITIEEDKANGGLKISGGVYATKYVSALGLATGNLSGGSSGGGGTAYDRLDAWGDYTTDKAGYVLSAGLGADLNSRVGANASSINSILSRLNSLEGGGTTSVTVTGSGNAITDISKGGTAIIATKGATFLTSHQSLAHLLRIDGSNGTAAGVSTLIGKLSDATADVLDSTKFVTSDNMGDATSKLYYRRPATALWNYIKGKADGLYLTHYYVNSGTIDANTTKGPGEYQIRSGATLNNFPTTEFGTLLSFPSEYNRANQLYMGYGNAGIWFRAAGFSSGWSVWQKILTSANYASVLGSVYQAKGDYFTNQGHLTNKNFDTIITSGAGYIDATSTNKPSTIGYGQLLTLHGSGDTITQMAFDYANSGNVWVRSGNPSQVGGTGTWKPWVQMLTVTNYASSLDSHYVTLGTAQTVTGAKTFSAAVAAQSFKKTGGTASQFLKADGSVDGNSYALASALSNYYTKTEADSRYVKKSGDTMTGALTLPRLNIVGTAASSAYLTADLATNAFVNVGGKTLMLWDGASISARPGGSVAGLVSLGTSAVRWSNVYATTINVTSTALVSNLNADMLDGYHESEFVRDRLLGSKSDYQHVVFLLWKDSAIGTHRIHGKIFTMGAGVSRYQAAEINLWFSRWNSTGYDWSGLFDVWGLGTHMRLVTCTYNGEKWWAIEHTNEQAIGVYFTGTANNVAFTKVHYYTSNPSTAVNAEINSSRQAVTTSTYYVNGVRNALLTDNVASATKLQTARSLWGQSFDGSANVSGNMTGVGSITGTNYLINDTASNPYLKLTHDSLAWHVQGWQGKLFIGQGSAHGMQIDRNGRVGIKLGSSASPAYDLDVTGTGRFTGELQVPTVYASNWFRSTGNSGWYSQTHGGGIYMTDANWVRVHNNKGFRVQEGVGIGTSGFIVGLKLHGASHEALEVSAGNYTMGLGCHNNGSWYWWRGTANPESAGNKSYVMQYDGSVWKFTGQLRCDSLRIGDAIFTYDAAHNGIKLDKGLYSEGYLSALGLSELTNTKFTISAGYESDALTILNGGIYRSEYWGDEWNKGHGALNVAIHGSSASQQTPLLLAVKADTPKTGWDAPGARLFAMELLDNGEQMKFQMGGSTIATLHKTNGLMATTLSVQTIKLNGGGTLTYDSATGDLRINGKKILVATT